MKAVQQPIGVLTVNTMHYDMPLCQHMHFSVTIDSVLLIDIPVSTVHFACQKKAIQPCVFCKADDDLKVVCCVFILNEL